MRHPKRSPRWAESRADYERSIGIEDRPMPVDSRDVVTLDLRSHGGRLWRIEPRLGYTSCRLVDESTGEVEACGTMKQLLRYLSRQVPHLMGARNLQ